MQLYVALARQGDHRVFLEFFKTDLLPKVPAATNQQRIS